MRRAMRVLGLMAAVSVLGGCAFMMSVVGEDVSSSHQDGGQVGVTAPVKTRAASANPRQLQAHAVAEARFEKEWNASYAMHFLGGMRFQNDWRFKYPYFYELTGGFGRYPGETVFELHPNVGMVFPQAGKSYAWFVRLGLPVVFFSGARETGTEFTVGVSLPARKPPTPRP